jgi:hypothetical protein
VDVGVDHPGQHQKTGGIDDLAGLQLICAHCENGAVADVDVGEPS